MSGGRAEISSEKSFENSIDFSMLLHRGFSQSNERTVQTTKRLLKKTYEDNKDPYSGVYTPISGDGVSSTQLLMELRTRSIIPTKNTSLNPMAYDPSEVQRVLKKSQFRRSILIKGASLSDH